MLQRLPEREDEELHLRDRAIAIEVEGTYHDLAAFVSGIASLPRIVTLHDYKIKSSKDLASQQMSITAKTYRYKEVEGGS